MSDYAELESFYLNLLTSARQLGVACGITSGMLTEGDEDGWLHLGDADLLTSLGRARQIPEQLFQLRPLLRLASLSDPRLEAALFAEQLYWQQLDRIRLQCFQAAVKPYVAAIRDAKMESLPFHDEQIARAELADLWLPPNPLTQLGFKNFVDKAKAAVGAVIQPWLFEFLPDVTPSYGGLFDPLD